MIFKVKQESYEKIGRDEDSRPINEIIKKPNN
jgi:hypothetical protein